MKDCSLVNTPIECGMKLNRDINGKKVVRFRHKLIEIQYSVSLISRYMENATELHLLGAKESFAICKELRDFGSYYKKSNKSNMTGYTDSNYTRDQDDRSTSNYVFMFGTSAISWSPKKQRIVTLSSTETKFVAATTCACQAIWMRKILNELSKEVSTLKLNTIF